MSGQGQLDGLITLARQRAWMVFTPEDNNADHQLFTASLNSTRDHLRTIGLPVSKTHHEPFAVDVGFLESALPNALANKSEATHIAAIHTGLAVTIHEFSLFCFAQSSFLPMIGHPDKEMSPSAADDLPPGVALLIASLRADQSQPVLERFIMPQCPHRNAAAHYLTLLMLRFVWLHEVAHGLLGHVDYLRHHTQSADISELHLGELAAIDPSIDGRVLQCLEFEADSWALAKSLAIQTQGGENIHGVASLHLALRLQMSLLAGFSLCWLMETLASTAKRGRLNITHPAPVRRLQMLQSIAARELGAIKMDSARMLRDVDVQLNDVLAQIGRQWLQTDRFEPDRYRAVFDETRKALAPYRYLTPDA